MTERFCKDCKHFRPQEKLTPMRIMFGPRSLSSHIDMCRAPQCGRDPVSGAPLMLPASSARSRNYGADYCGPDGKWFEPHDASA